MDFKSFKYLDHYKKDAESFDYFEKRCGATEHDERRVREFIISQIDGSNKLILDVGSGSSWAAKMLSARHKIVSLDISTINIKKALSLTRNDNHFGVVADAYKLPFKCQLFDYIIASEVLEHTVNPASFIHSLLEKVKTGGIILLSTPYKEKITYSLCIHCNQPTPVNAHLHSFDEIKLVNMVRSESCRTKFYTFGNKALIHLRTYILLKFLPFTIWRQLDWIANKLINAPLHILVMYKKI